VDKIADILVNNSGVFGGEIEGERSQLVSKEVLEVFGAGYKDVEGIKNTMKNPSATDKQKEIAKQNLGILGKGIFVAMNNSFANFGEGAVTITSQISAEDIDGLLPEELRGVGQYVVEADGKASVAEKVEVKKRKIKKEAARRSGSRYDENLSATRSFRGAGEGVSTEDKNGEDGQEKGMPLFMMSKEDVVNLEMTQRNKEQFHFSPPYPPWLKEMSDNEQRLWLLRVRLVNGTAYKQALRNMDAEKLMFNRGLDMTKGELRLLCEAPGTQEAMRMMFNDLFEKIEETGEQFLRLKRKPGKDDVFGLPLDDNTEYYLTHFEAYKEGLALMLDKKAGSIKDGMAMYRNGIKASNESRGAVGMSWNFLYLGNIIESADVDRQLKPTEVVSDKIRTMLHPLQKALGKWGVYKTGGERREFDGVTGEEEPMGGEIATWVQYHLELDKIRGTSSFRDKLRNREIRPLPERMGCSLVEMLYVNYEENGSLKMEEKKKKNGEVELDDNGNPKMVESKMLMSKALSLGKKISFPKDIEGEDLDIFTDFRDAMDGTKTAFDYLNGKNRLELAKNEHEWARNFQKDIALIRQTKTESTSSGRKYLSFLDDPEFMVWVIAASTGFESLADDIMLDAKSIKYDGSNYKGRIREIVNLPGLVPIRDRQAVLERLGGDKGEMLTMMRLAKITQQVVKNRRDLMAGLEREKRK